MEQKSDELVKQAAKKRDQFISLGKLAELEDCMDLVLFEAGIEPKLELDKRLEVLKRKCL